VPNITGNPIVPTQHETPTVLQRMSDAINAHDVDALVSCFANDYKSEQPLHPESAFTGLGVALAAIADQIFTLSYFVPTMVKLMSDETLSQKAIQ
jgi:hypothetical protein